jgi:hypothetical protein
MQGLDNRVEETEEANGSPSLCLLGSWLIPGVRRIYNRCEDDSVKQQTASSGNNQLASLFFSALTVLLSRTTPTPPSLRSLSRSWYITELL